MRTVRQLYPSLVIAAIVWFVWLAVLGPAGAYGYVADNWPVALTMVFGSLVAGATSEGGGAIAFPIFTKLLQVAPADAKLFSLAIQSIGMTAASLVIVLMRLKVEWCAIRWASLGGRSVSSSER